MVAPRRPGTPGSGPAAKPAFDGNAGSAPKPGGTAPLPGTGTGNALDSFFADIDFDSVETFAQLTVGQHLGQVASVVSNYSSNGNPQLEITFRIVGGPNDGRSSKYWLVKTPNTIWKVKQFLASLGYTDEEMKSANNQNMVGRYTILVVALDDYRNDGSTRIVNTIPYDDPEAFASESAANPGQ